MDWARAIQDSALGAAMRADLILYPIVETAHILGVAVLVGAIILLDLSLLGWGRHGRPDLLLRQAVPVAAAGLLLAATTGFALFSAQATDYIGNPVFLTKQTLILLGLANIIWFHLSPGRDAPSWPAARPPRSVRVAALASALIWIGVLVCGRMIAYVG